MRPIYLLAIPLAACVPAHQPPCERPWEVYVAGRCQPQHEDLDAAPDGPTAPETAQPEPDAPEPDRDDDDDDRDDDKHDRHDDDDDDHDKDDDDDDDDDDD